MAHQAALDLLAHEHREAVQEEAGSRRPDVLDQAQEGPGVAGLLPHLVQGVGAAGVDDVAALGQGQGEGGDEHGLEADTGLQERRHLLPGEGGPLLGREPVLVGVDGEQGVGDELTVGELAPGEALLGLDDPSDRGRVEALDPEGDGIVPFGRVGHGCGHGPTIARRFL